MNKFLISIILIFYSLTVYPYDLIKGKSIINETNENIDVYYENCTNDLNDSAVCTATQKITIPSHSEGENIGKVENKLGSIYVTRIISKSRSVHYASVSDWLQYVAHGYNEQDIMTCRVVDDAYINALLIEENVDHVVTCRDAELFTN